MTPAHSLRSCRIRRRVHPAHSGSVGHHNTTLYIGHRDFASLRQITGLAYGIQRVRIVGGPPWMDSDLYRTTAKAEDSDAATESVQAMLQTLLAERFKLVVHRESKQLPVYTLSPAKNGSKLKEAKHPGKPSTTPGAPDPAKPGVVQLGFQNMYLAGLVNFLANMLGNPVLDNTGLDGRYNFTLEWAYAPSAQSTDAGPSIFDAVEEQLGLKLEAKKAAVDVMVVDRAEKPTEN